MFERRAEQAPDPRNWSARTDSGIAPRGWSALVGRRSQRVEQLGVAVRRGDHSRARRRGSDRAPDRRPAERSRTRARRLGDRPRDLRPYGRARPTTASRSERRSSESPGARVKPISSNSGPEQRTRRTPRNRPGRLSAVVRYSSMKSSRRVTSSRHRAIVFAAEAGMPASGSRRRCGVRRGRAPTRRRRATAARARSDDVCDVAARCAAQHRRRIRRAVVARARRHWRTPTGHRSPPSGDRLRSSRSSPRSWRAAARRFTQTGICQRSRLCGAEPSSRKRCCVSVTAVAVVRRRPSRRRAAARRAG